MDMLLVPNLSTESTQFYPSALQYTRFERTALISNEPATYKYLNVCVHSHLTTNKINCSECYKCMRTLITLEALGKLEEYQQVFDLMKYKKNKNLYLGRVLSRKKKLTLDDELLKFLKDKNQKISWRAYLYSWKIRQYRIRKKIFKNR